MSQSDTKLQAHMRQIGAASQIPVAEFARAVQWIFGAPNLKRQRRARRKTTALQCRTHARQLRQWRRACKSIPHETWLSMVAFQSMQDLRARKQRFDYLWNRSAPGLEHSRETLEYRPPSYSTQYLGSANVGSNWLEQYSHKYSQPGEHNGRTGWKSGRS